MNQRAQGIRPAADGKSYTTLRGNAIERHSYTKDAPGELLFEWKNDKENRDIADYQFSPDGKLLLLSIGSEPIYRHSYTTDYYLKDADGLRPILTDLSDTRDASFSPDGRTIAFSSGNNLYLYDTSGIPCVRSRQTVHGTGLSTVRPTGYMKRSAPSRRLTLFRPTDRRSPTCVSTNPAYPFSR